MTSEEAARAGRGRKTFAVILLRDSSGGTSGLIFIDAEQPGLFGDLAIEDLALRVNQRAAGKDELGDSLSRVRNALGQDVRGPMRR